MDILYNKNKNLIPSLQKSLVDAQSKYYTVDNKSNYGSTESNFYVGTYGNSNFSYNAYSSYNQHPNVFSR